MSMLFKTATIILAISTEIVAVCLDHLTGKYFLLEAVIVNVCW